MQSVICKAFCPPLSLSLLSKSRSPVETYSLTSLLLLLLLLSRRAESAYKPLGDAHAACLTVSSDTSRKLDL